MTAAELRGDLRPRPGDRPARPGRASRGSGCTYDAGYVALAEAVADRPVPLLTADARLARAIADRCDVPVLLAD